MKRATERLSSLWESRIVGRIADSRDEYIGWCQEAGIRPEAPAGEQFGKLIEGGMSLADAVDFCCLQVSFERRDLRADRATKRLQEINSCLAERGATPTFQVPFQAGLIALVSEDFSRALEQFLAARRIARDEREQHWAFFNAILCMENLGYEFGTYLRQFRKSFEPHKAAAWAQPIFHQAVALEARAAFRAADFKAMQQLASTASSGDQACYFLLWLQRLPTLNLGNDEIARGRTLKSLYDSNEGFLVPFRIRTLSGLLIEEDLRSATRLTARIERLYLWTWLWLVEPDPARLAKVLRTWEQIRRTLDAHLTLEHYLMLECSLRWLSLFLGHDDSLTRASLASLSYPMGTSIAILEYERLALDYFHALRDGESYLAPDTATVLGTHELAHEPRFRLHRLIDSVTAGKAEGDLAELARSILSLSRETGSPSPGIVVDRIDRSVSVLHRSRKREEMRSHSLAQLFYVTFQRPSVPISDCLKACFQLPQYEAAIHDPKIANLLARANRLAAPFVRFTRRDSHVYREGDSKHIAFRGNCAHTESLSPFGDNHGLFSVEEVATATRGFEGPSGKALARGEWLERGDLENFLKLSRSSILRRVADWKKQGLVETQGVGKAVRYRLSPTLEKELAFKEGAP